MQRVGYLPCTQDPPSGANMTRVIDEIIAEAQMAEASGWDGCFISEHHQQADGYLPNPLLMASLVGMRTQRLTISTSVLLLPLHHPVHVAEDCAVIDLATQGRLILGVGVGYQVPDFAAFEVPIAERATRTAEALAILGYCWSGQRFSFSGQYFHYQDTLITPPPSGGTLQSRSTTCAGPGSYGRPCSPTPLVESTSTISGARKKTAPTRSGRPSAPTTSGWRS